MNPELDELRALAADVVIDARTRTSARAALDTEIAAARAGGAGLSRRRRPRRRDRARGSRRAGAIMAAASTAIAAAVVVIVVLAAASGSGGPRVQSAGAVPAAARPLTRILGVLRRPQTPADLGPQVTQILDRRSPFGGTGTPIRSLIRLATVTPWGDHVFLVPYAPLTAAQIDRLPPLRRRFERLRAARVGGQDALGFFDDGGGGCCALAREIERRGDSQFGGGAGMLTEFVEVVPDGVSKVSLLVARQDYPEGPIAPRPTIATAAVHGNVFAVQINRTVDDLGSRQIWYGATGAVIKRIGATSTSALNHVVLPPKPSPPTALSRRAERNPATPNPVTITPAIGGARTTFTVRFRLLLNGASYLYRLYGPGGKDCQGRAQLTYGWQSGYPDSVRGQIAINSYKAPGDGVVYTHGRPGLPPWCPGSYRITVSASTTGPVTIGPSVVPFGSATFVVRR